MAGGSGYLARLGARRGAAFDPLHSNNWSALVTRWSDEEPIGELPDDTEENSQRGDRPAATEDAVRPLSTAQRVASAATSPTTAVPTAASQPALVGWRAYRRLFVAGAPQAVVIAHPPATAAGATAIFLLCLLGGSLITGRRRDWFIALTAVAAAFCLLLPQAYSPLATGAFLGLIASFVVKWPKTSDRAETPTRTWNRPSAISAKSSAILILLANLAVAQESAPVATDGRDEPKSLHSILIPVDAARRPAGTKLYVSEPFLRELLAHGAEPTAPNGQWLISDSSIRAELRQRPEDAELTAGLWTLTLEVEVLARNTTVLLPLVRDEATWPATVELDGIPLPLEWRDDGRSCAIHVAEPGRYQLTISYTPQVRVVAGRSQIELTLPPLLGGSFELAHPADLSGIEVAGTISDQVTRRESGRLRGDLDDSGRLVVRWPPPAAPAGTESLPITELRWLHFGAEKVEMAVKYSAPRDAPLPQTLLISADRRWEFVTNVNGFEDVRIDDESNDRQAVHVTLLEDDAQRGEVTLRWRLAGSSTLGRVRLPFMELSASSAGPCWMAISSDSSWECGIVDSVGLTAESADEFMALWDADAGEEPPQLVVANVAADNALSVAVRPRSAESAIDEMVHVAAGASSLRVQYQADVVPGDLHRFQFSMAVPAKLSVDQVVVTQAGRPIELRWARHDDSQVTAFFAKELVESYRIVLTGHVPRHDTEECALPRITATGEVAAMERVQVYREEPVLVEVLGPIAADDAAPDLPPNPWNARLLAAYQLDPAVADRVRLAITPNRVETVGETLTALDREVELWSATFIARLTVRRGELDTLRLRVPTTWVGPYEIQPAGVVAKVSSMPDAEHAMLSLHLPEAVARGQLLALEIHGPLAPVSGVPMTVPEIAPESPSRWRSYVSVPTGSDSQPVSWTSNGVRPAEPPANLQRSRSTPSADQTFRVMERPYRVTLAPPQATRPSASVRLADTTVMRGPAGNQLFATRFVVAPQGLPDCELELPAGQQLVSAKLDGQPARIRPVSTVRWTISLGAPELPQILDIVSREVGSGDAGNHRVELQRPRLFANGSLIPVELSLWSFGQQRISGPAHIEGASVVTAVDQAALRLERLVGIAEAATPAALSLPLPDGYNWFQPWVRQLTIAQDDARATLAKASSTGAASQVLRPSEDQLQQASRRIDTWIERSYEMMDWPDLAPPFELTSAYDVQVWPPESDRLNGWIHCVADGTADRMSLELSPAVDATSADNLIGVLAIACLAASVVWLARRPAARDLVCRWPNAVGVLGGIAWWAWLWPSWLGILIAATSLWLLFRPGWPGRSIRSDGSTVLQTGRSH